MTSAQFKPFSLALQIIILAALCLTIYEPALYQPPRADQLIYLYLNHGVDSLYQLTIGESTFNRTVVGGDTLLFRPVLYWLLGLENWAFGYHFIYWQLTNILLHISIAITMLVLLRQVTKDPYVAFGAALLLAGTSAGMEMVAWQHISGYLLFCLLLMLSFTAFHRYLESRLPIFGYLSVIIIGLSAFTYELGSVVAILMASILAWRWFSGAAPKHDATLALCFVAIPIMYATLSFGGLYLQYGTIVPSQIPGNDVGRHHPAQAAMSILQAYFYYLFYWLVAFITPSLATICPGGRITAGPLLSPGNVLQYLNLSVAFVLLELVVWALLIRAFKRRPTPAALSLLFVVAGTLIAYDAILILGRGSERGYIPELYSNSYYAYPFAILIIIMIGIILGGAADGGKSVLRVLALALLSVVAMFTSTNVYYIQNVMLTTFSEPRLAFIDRVLAAQAAAPKDQPFTFSLAPSCLNDPLPWFPKRVPGKSGLPDPKQNFTVAYVLWPDAYRPTGGTVLIDCGKPGPVAQ